MNMEESDPESEDAANVPPPKKGRGEFSKKTRVKKSSLFETYDDLIEPVYEDENIVAAYFKWEGKFVTASNGSLSNVYQHLSDCYFPLLTDEDKKARKQRVKRMKSSAAQGPTLLDSIATGSSRQSKLKTVIAKACAMGCLPLSITRNPGFIYLIRILCPKAKIPSPTAITREIDVLYESAIDWMKKSINLSRSDTMGNTFVAITTDLWTSRSFHGHHGLAVFLIDKEWKLRVFPVGCSPLLYPHNASRIAGNMVDMLNEVGITRNDVIAATSDNESAKELLQVDSGVQIGSVIGCCAHTLNLCIEAAASVPPFQVAFDNVKAMINFFGKSVKKRELLEKKQKELSQPVVRFIKPAPTRWNYISDCIERACRLLHSIQGLTAENLELAKESEIHEWETLRNQFCESTTSLSLVRPLLHHASTAIQTLSWATKPTVNRIFEQALAIYDKSDKDCGSDSILVKSFCERLRAEVNDRFYTTPFANCITLAEIMDPYIAYSKIPLETDEESKKIEKMTSLDLAFACAREFFAPSRSASVQPIVLRKEQMSKRVATGIELELEEYLQLLKRDKPAVNVDALAFWKEHKKQFPCVAHAARSLLCIQASSSEVERMFSTAGYIVNKYRTSLTGPRAAKLIVLSRFYRQVEEETEQEVEDATESGILDDDLMSC